MFWSIGGLKVIKVFFLIKSDFIVFKFMKDDLERLRVVKDA